MFMCPQITSLCELLIGKHASGAGLYDKMLTTSYFNENRENRENK